MKPCRYEVWQPPVSSASASAMAAARLPHLAEPARHHARATGETHVRPRPSGCARRRAALAATSSALRHGKLEIDAAGARIAHRREFAAAAVAMRLPPRCCLPRSGRRVCWKPTGDSRAWRRDHAGTVHPGAELLRHAEALPVRGRRLRLRSAGRTAGGARRLATSAAAPTMPTPPSTATSSSMATAWPRCSILPAARPTSAAAT